MSDIRVADFLAIGECVAGIVRTPGRPDVPHPGGSPANVAYGPARPQHGAAHPTRRRPRGTPHHRPSPVRRRPVARGPPDGDRHPHRRRHPRRRRRRHVRLRAALDALTTLGLTGPAARPAPAALDEAALTRVLRHAGAAAALTVSRPGADPPGTRELHAALT